MAWNEPECHGSPIVEYRAMLLCGHVWTVCYVGDRRSAVLKNLAPATSYSIKVQVGLVFHCALLLLTCRWTGNQPYWLSDQSGSLSADSA